MWESKSFSNEQSGGFFNSPAGEFGSPAGKQEKSTRRAQNVVSVCIRQILECPEDAMKIESLDIHMVTFVAFVRHIDIQSTKITYTLDDCSGGIMGVIWIESNENGENASSVPNVVEDTYCRIFGSMRSNQGKKHVFIFRIFSLKSMNELTRHILEVMYTPLKLKSVSSMESMKAPPMETSSSNNMSNSFMTNSNMSDPTGFSPQQTLVYNAIMKNSKDIGAQKDEIIKELTGRMNAREVINIVDFLCNEGHIYTTIDDEHFRCTDN